MVSGEGFDGDLLEVVRDTTPFVLDGDADVRSGRDAGPCFLGGDFSVFGAEADRSALGEGFFGVVKQGNEQFFDACGGKQDKEGLLAGEKLQKMLGAEVLLPAGKVLRQKGMEIEFDGRAALAVTAEALELLNEIESAPCGAFDDIGVVLVGGVFKVFFEHQRVVEDDHEEIVEIVRQPS